VAPVDPLLELSIDVERHLRVRMTNLVHHPFDVEIVAWIQAAPRAAEGESKELSLDRFGRVSAWPMGDGQGAAGAAPCRSMRFSAQG
jgi:hypothetical protein